VTNISANHQPNLNHRRLAPRRTTLPKFQLQILSRGSCNGSFVIAYGSSSFVSIQATAQYGFTTNSKKEVLDAKGNVLWYQPSHSGLMPIRHTPNRPAGSRTIAAAFDGSLNLIDGKFFKFAVCSNHLYVISGFRPQCANVKLQGIQNPSVMPGNDILNAGFEDPTIAPWNVDAVGAMGMVSTARAFTGSHSFQAIIQQTSPKRDLVPRKGIATGTNRLTLNQGRRRHRRQLSTTSNATTPYYVSFYYFITTPSNGCSLTLYYDTAQIDGYTIAANGTNVGAWKQAQVYYLTDPSTIYVDFVFACEPGSSTAPAETFYVDQIVARTTSASIVQATTTIPIATTLQSLTATQVVTVDESATTINTVVQTVVVTATGS